jgi:hypothetical protein
LAQEQQQNNDTKPDSKANANKPTTQLKVDGDRGFDSSSEQSLLDSNKSFPTQFKAIDVSSSGVEKSMSARFNPIQRQENKTGLPDHLKSGMENISGHSMDDVKVHRNSAQPAQLNAHAFAQGTEIHLGSGQEKHLAHELGHVVQQKEGRVKATKQLKGKFQINDDSGLEKEADVLGNAAMQFKQTQTSSSPQLEGKNVNQTFQLSAENQEMKENSAERATSVEAVSSSNDNATESDGSFAKNTEILKKYGEICKFIPETLGRLTNILKQAEGEVLDPDLKKLIAIEITNIGSGIANILTAGASELITAPIGAVAGAAKSVVKNNINSKRYNSDGADTNGVLKESGKAAKDETLTALTSNTVDAGKEAAIGAAPDLLPKLDVHAISLGVSEETAKSVADSTPIVGGIIKIIGALYSLSTIQDQHVAITLNNSRSDLILMKVFIEGTIEQLDVMLSESKFQSTTTALKTTKKALVDLNVTFNDFDQKITKPLGKVDKAKNAGKFIANKLGGNKELKKKELLPNGRDRSAAFSNSKDQTSGVEENKEMMTSNMDKRENIGEDTPMKPGNLPNGRH